MAEDILRLTEYESKAILSLSTRVPGEYVQKMSIIGNSILSSIFVESLDPGASVLVEYFDYGVGGDEGESYPLAAHDPVATALTTNRLLISNLHDKPYVKCTVTGGNARFGVYITVVLTSATDVDNALQREGDAVALPTDKGMPVMVFDEISGVWRFARGEEGIQDVRVVGNVAIGEPGEPVFVDSAPLVTTPGIEQTVLSYTVPALSTLNLLSVILACRQDASFTIYGDGSRIGSGRTGPAQSNVNFAYRVARSYAAGKIIEVKATARNGSAPGDIECYVQGTLS